MEALLYLCWANAYAADRQEGVAEAGDLLLGWLDEGRNEPAWTDEQRQRFRTWARYAGYTGRWLNS